MILFGYDKNQEQKYFRGFVAGYAGHTGRKTTNKNPTYQRGYDNGVSEKKANNLQLYNKIKALVK